MRLRSDWTALLVLSHLVLVSGDDERAGKAWGEFQPPAFYMATDSTTWSHLRGVIGSEPVSELQLREADKPEGRVLASAYLKGTGLLALENGQNTMLAFQRQTRLFLLEEVGAKACVEAMKKDLVVLLQSETGREEDRQSCLRTLVMANSKWPHLSSKSLAHLTLVLPQAPCRLVSFVITKVTSGWTPLSDEEEEDAWPSDETIHKYVEELEQSLMSQQDAIAIRRVSRDSAGARQCMT